MRTRFPGRAHVLLERHNLDFRQMIYQKLYEKAIYPAYHWLMKDGANAAIRELHRNERLERAALHDLSLEKLRNLLAFAAIF
jgi:hypothetical protein